MSWNELKTTHVSDQRLSLGEFSENELFQLVFKTKANWALLTPILKKMVHIISSNLVCFNTRNTFVTLTRHFDVYGIVIQCVQPSRPCSLCMNNYRGGLSPTANFLINIYLCPIKKWGQQKDSKANDSY